MPSYLHASFRVVAVCLLLLALTSFAHAQCGVNSIGFGDVALVPGNPFTAEIVFTSSGKPDAVTSLSPSHPESVARDSQGRVRTDRVAGQFKRDNGPEAGTKIEQHLIMICDPLAQTLTEIDTLSATAKIRHSQPSATSAPSQRTFCSSRLPSGRNDRVGAEDLGDQTIEGVLAHGVRITMPMLGASSGESTSERWCSDQLAAVVLTVSQSAHSEVKLVRGMRNIERSEPDPTLFQIPADYAVTESVAEPRPRHTPAAPPLPTDQP